MNFANIITVVRLLFTPIIIWLIFSSYYYLGLIFFVLSGLSDALDGFIAKQFNQRTILGSYLDPVADKTLIVSSILALGYMGAIPSWLIILIVSRDLAILGAVIISWLVERSLKIEPIISSKINTFLQIFYIGLILLNLSSKEEIIYLNIFILPTFSILIALSTLPSNILNPEDYAKRIKGMSKYGLKVEVLNETKMKKLGMDSLLGVGRGSQYDSQLVIIKWDGLKTKKTKPLCFVGKGVCFDSGGISLKPGNKMEEMIGDMGGSAAVVGLMKSLAYLQELLLIQPME